VHPFVQQLRLKLPPVGNPKKIAAMKQYMRGQFEYLGVQTPDRRNIFKQVVSETGLPDTDEMPAVVRELWQQPEREYSHCAVDLLDKMAFCLSPLHRPLLEELITTKSWWDTVDMLATHHVAYLFRHYPACRDRAIRDWTRHDNIWLHRSSILFQLKYKQHTDRELLFSLIKTHGQSDEFFIQKAIGWALREYSKTAPESVRAFVEKTKLTPLSQREALKHLNRKT